MKKLSMNIRLIILFILTGATSRFPYFLPEIFQNDLHIAPSKATLVVTIGGLICTFISIPLVGFIADKFGYHKRIIVVLAILMATVSIILFPMLKTFSTLLLGFSVVWGILYGYRDAIDIYTSIITEEQNSSFFAARSWYYLGYALVSLIIGNESFLHFPSIYYLYACVLISLVTFFVFSFEPIENINKDINKSNSYKELFSNKNFILITIVGFFLGGMSISFTVSMGYFVNFMTHHNYYGFSRSLIGIFTGSTYFISFIIMLLLDKLTTKIKVKKMSIISIILIFIGSIIVWISTNVYLDTAVFLIVFSLVEPLFILIGFDMISKSTSTEVRGMAIGFYNLIGFGLSGVIFTVVSGIVADTNPPLVFAIYAVSSVLALIFMILIKYDNINPKKVK